MQSRHCHMESEEICMSDYLIEAKKLTKIYGEQAAVKEVDLHVKKGRIYGLLGRNGAGKTTIMKMILGLTSITSGEVEVFGRNMKGHEKHIYPRIGVIDHGILLEENTMKALEKKNRKYILLRVSDMPKAMLILEQEFRVTDFAMCDSQTLCLYDTSLDMGAINKALFMHDVSVISSQLCNDTLEEYFKRITGGEGIA